MRRTNWMAIGLALAACQCESGPTPARTVTTPEPATPMISETANVRIHMAAHEQSVVDLQMAIAHGRLTDAREHAAWLAGHEMDAPPEWQPYVDEMRIAARRVERARDLATAGMQLGRLGRACSSCHERFDAIPAFSYPPPPTDLATLDAQMERHQWAAARLWEGIIGPSDFQWIDGATVMAMTRLDIAAAAHDKPNADVVELAERLREQATKARGMIDRDARAAFYGEMMDTCTSCHAIVRPQPVAATRYDE